MAGEDGVGVVVRGARCEERVRSAIVGWVGHNLGVKERGRAWTDRWGESGAPAVPTDIVRGGEG